MSCMGLKISTIVDDKVWKEFKRLSEETHQSLSGMLSEALQDYVNRKRLRPVFLKHLKNSMDENEELGRLLAK